MTKEIAVEIATKYANDIWLFGGVDKECVSEVCKVLLSELDIANKKLDKIKELIEGKEVYNNKVFNTKKDLLLSFIEVNKVILGIIKKEESREK